MGFRFSYVCLVCVALVVCSVISATAATGLGDDEMSALRGGCLKCNTFYCGGTATTCTQTANGLCSSTAAGWPRCNNIQQNVTLEWDCGGGPWWTATCTTGSATPCGYTYQCYCSWLGYCKTTEIGHGWKFDDNCP